MLLRTTQPSLLSEVYFFAMIIANHLKANKLVVFKHRWTNEIGCDKRGDTQVFRVQVHASRSWPKVARKFNFFRTHEAHYIIIGGQKRRECRWSICRFAPSSSVFQWSEILSVYTWEMLLTARCFVLRCSRQQEFLCFHLLLETLRFEKYSFSERSLGRCPIITDWSYLSLELWTQIGP